MNILLQTLVEGYAGRSRGGASTSRSVIATPAKHLPAAKPFTPGEFEELCAAMGGITVVKKTGAA